MSSAATAVGIRPGAPADAGPIADIYNQGIAGRDATFDTDAVGPDDVAGWLGGDREPVLVAVLRMRELGIDVASQRPQRLTTELAARADAVITMGCGDACPVIPGKKQLRADWDLPDPKDRPLDEVRSTRDDIEHRVRDLVAELDRTAAA